jgi:ribosome-associated protein
VRSAVKAAIDMKATDLKILDLRGRTSFCDWFILCNGTNSRQLQAISEHILREFKKELNLNPLGVEGTRSSKWVLIDLGDVIVHVFEREMRGYYDLDGLWSDALSVTPEDLGIEDIPPEATGHALP